MPIHQVIETLAESGLAPMTLARLIESLIIEDTEHRVSQIRAAMNEKIQRLCRKHNVHHELEEYHDNQRIAQLELTREFPLIEYLEV